MRVRVDQFQRSACRWDVGFCPLADAGHKAFVTWRATCANGVSERVGSVGKWKTGPSDCQIQTLEVEGRRSFALVKDVTEVPFQSPGTPNNQKQMVVPI